MERKIYGVIGEWKTEQPIIMESPLMTCEEARIRMRNLAARADVIRVAIFKAIHEDGNETILQKEKENV